MASILSQVLVFGVLISFLVIGFLYTKDPKTVKEYALGSRKFSTLALICTMVASAFGGSSILGRPATLYQSGVWFFLAMFAMPIGDCITSLVVIPRLSKYYGCMSVAEVIGRMYGTPAKRLVGFFAFIYCLGILSAQIKALHWVMEEVFVQNALIATVLGAFIIMLYASKVSASSFIKTDIIHFFIFIVILPLVASYIIRTSGGIATITNYPHESGRPFFYGGSITAFIAFILLSLAPSLEPDIFHRYLIGRDCKKNQSALYAVAFASLANVIVVGCIAFIALAKFPSMQPRNITFAVVQSFITAKWAMTLFTLALVSVIVAVARSSINAGAILLVNDVITKKISERQKLRLLKLVTVLSVIVALSSNYLFSNVSEAIIFFAAWYFVIIVVPLVGGLFVKKTRQEPFWASISIGLITFSILYLRHHNLSHEISVISAIASLSAYLAAVFAFNKMERLSFTFSLSKICDGIIARHSIQTSNLSWIILLFFLFSMFFKDMYDEKDTITMVIEGMTGALGFLLFFVDKLPIKHRNAVVLSIIWYCFAFSPVYVFLHQTVASLFTINFIVSIVLLAGLFSWDVFLTFLISGSSIAVVTFGLFSRGFQTSVAPLMHLSLFLGYIAMVAYLAFRDKERVIIESVRSKLEAEKSLEQGIKEAHMYNKIMQAVNTSIDADNKYKNVLLNEDKTIMVSFAELKENILAYFQKVSIERKTKFMVANSQHKVLNTGLPLSFFYKTIYSLILNVFYCNDTEDIKVKFFCNKSGKILRIEISHGQYKIKDRAKYLRGSYPQDILEWDIIKLLFEQLEIKMTEGLKTLKIIFPSEATPIENNVISFETLRVRANREKAS
jgi:SSS family solute:Na+ symporter